MEVKDLMIGDWVIDGKNIAQITSITCDGIIETTFNKSSNIEVLEPIPITPEILEKNGFKLNPQGSYSIGRNISIDMLDGRYNANMNTNNPQAPSFLYLVGKYVHELQHALRLCGIKKEIEL